MQCLCDLLWYSIFFTLKILGRKKCDICCGIVLNSDYMTRKYWVHYSVLFSSSSYVLTKCFLYTHSLLLLLQLCTVLCTHQFLPQLQQHWRCHKCKYWVILFIILALMLHIFSFSVFVHSGSSRKGNLCLLPRNVTYNTGWFLRFFFLHSINFKK